MPIPCPHRLIIGDTTDSDDIEAQLTVQPLPIRELKAMLDLLLCLQARETPCQTMIVHQIKHIALQYIHT